MTRALRFGLVLKISMASAAATATPLGPLAMPPGGDAARLRVAMAAADPQTAEANVRSVLPALPFEAPAADDADAATAVYVADPADVLPEPPPV